MGIRAVSIVSAARSVDPEACDRCGVQKATNHLEFAFSGPWNVCVACWQKLIAFHAKGGRPKQVAHIIVTAPRWGNAADP